ncbi:hypothetical protein KGF54_004907 [Candida jiufengensis]|uniref:uncharacterized protein n=1 Tax=Candida jiufengensis TaxID=497108 RepID=UPI0022245D8F|nr:uncharacterized protein KGF54_004907 [Candida jiufengensis]KAI5951832.1 hypothetical protein KGF54_004907 [Candida jiufengensis]
MTSKEETPTIDIEEILKDRDQIKFTNNPDKYFTKSEKQQVDIEKTSNRFSYLLGLTSLFSHFIEAKASKDPLFRRIVDDINSKSSKSKSQTNESIRRRKTEKEEDAELLNEQEIAKQPFEFFESPGYVNGTLRPYQIQGLNWLVSLYENNLSGILADEMGLGKTLQTIAFLGYLRFIHKINGPHLVVAPKSTLDNWQREFNRWIPDINVLVLQGDKEERANLIKNRILTCNFDVVIASYEIVIREKATFKKFDWEYIVIDEAHRIKNEESLLSQIIRMFHSKNRLLITGTPLQNNLRELWALLNFILPDVFADNESFDEWFSQSESTDEEDKVISQLHKVLKPFLLRRIKADVEKSLLPKKELNIYTKMSPMQKNLYQKILEKDIDAVNGANKKESKTRLLNIVMQLRKCCNHPYLFDGVEPGPPYTTDEHLVFNAQKMIILDQLLKKFRSEGSRVLIFSQMSRMLDILEDYCYFREYPYCRIDGQTEHSDRINAIDEYNAPGSEKFVFLLTTRAGGLGINLTSADVVILFDSDWNPQADLQAMDRAHRIGQTKQVKVFRFITENAIEEKVLERAAQKLRLDQLVIQQGRNSNGLDGQQSGKAANKNELLDMIQHGAVDIFKNEGGESDESNDIDIEDILKRSEEKTQELNDKYSKLNLNALQNFSNDESVYDWNGENFKRKEPTAITNIGHAWINPGKRERKENYSIDTYYRDVLNTGNRAQPTINKSGPKPPKQLNLYDHQFYPAKVLELYELEKNYYKKQINYQVPLKSGDSSTEKERELEQKLEQEEINNSRPLTEEEKILKTELMKQGYGNWNRKDFYNFIAECVKYGRNSIPLIKLKFPEKTEDEVREYAKAFWLNYEEIEGFEKYIAQIEQGEDKIIKLKLQKEALRRKISQYKYPLLELKLKYPPSSNSKKVYSEEEDRFLLVQLYRFGIDSPGIYESIKDAIRDSPLFQFDFFLQSRNLIELSRRCQTLLLSVTKEINPEQQAKLNGSSNGNNKRSLKDTTPTTTFKKAKK